MRSPFYRQNIQDWTVVDRLFSQHPPSKPCLVVKSRLLLCFCCPGVPFLPNLPGLPHHVNFHHLGHHHQSSAGSPMRGYVCSETPAQIPEADPGQTHRIADMVGCRLSWPQEILE